MTSPYKKKIKPGLIELDPEQPTIIVNVVTQLIDPASLDSDGKPSVVSSHAEQRRFKLKSFTPSSNTAKFAAAFVAKCELIHESKTRHVEALLVQLAERMREQQGGGGEEDEWGGMSEPPSASSPTKADRLNSTAPVSLAQSTTYSSSASSLSTTAPLALHTRQAKASKHADDDDEQKEPDTPQTPSSSKAPHSPTTPTSLRPSAPSRSRRDDRGDDDADDNDDDRRPRRKARDDPIVPRPRHSDADSREEKGRDRSSSRPAHLSVRDRSTPDEELTPSSSPSPTRSNRSDSRGSPDPSRSRERPPPPRSPARLRPPTRRDRDLPPASIDSVDTYIEQLYDDLPSKVQATGALLRVISDPSHLPHFADPSHHNVLEILSRVLSEDRKKSTELTLNIVEIFFTLSAFSQLHPLLLSNHMGELTMKVVALEMKRFDVRMEEARGRKRLDKSTQAFMAKQDRLLFLSFFLLLNVSEDTHIEMKMKERDLIRTLIKALERSSALAPLTASDMKDELAVLTLTFLKKLSVFEENKSEMVGYGVTEALRGFIAGKWAGEGGQEAALRLLFNLSFDDRERKRMVELGYLALCAEVLKKAGREGAGRTVTAVAVRLLYSLSMDGQWRSEVQRACAGVLNALLGMLVDAPGKLVDVDLVALLINLTAPSASDADDADLHPERLHGLVKRLQQSLDPLLFKLLHHLTNYQPSLAPLFGRHSAELLGLTARAPSDCLYDALGVAANLPMDDADFNDLLLQYNLASTLARHVQGSDDDVRLQAVRVVGVVASSDAAVRKLTKESGILKALLATLRRADDVDATAQAMYTVWRLVRWSSGRKALCEASGAMEVIAGLMGSEIACVRELSLLCCEEVMAESADWRERMKAMRFEKFNRRWIDAVGLQDTGQRTKAGGRASRAGRAADDDADDYTGQRPKTAGKAKALIGRRDGRRKSRSRSVSPVRSRSPSI